MRKNLWISLRRFKVHEFHQTLNYIHSSGLDYFSIYLRLGEIQHEFSKRLAKLITSLFVTYLFLATFGTSETVGFTFQSASLEIPTPYVSFLSSLILFFTVLNVQSLFTIIVVRSAITAKQRLKRFSYGAYGMFNAQDEMAMSIPIIEGSFLKERLPVTGLLIVILAGIMLAFTFPLLAVWQFLFRIQYSFVSVRIADFQILRDSPTAWPEFLFAVTGVLILVATMIYVVLFNIPMPFRKGRFFIRWGFLIEISGAERHPMIDKWLNDKVGLKD